ncbi:MAG: HAMP domain-containing sensor histidine kinase [Cyanobacteria bacterium J06623_4]
MTRASSSADDTAAAECSEPENLRLAYRRLLALERFKSGFLARTAHELRSPINTIVSLNQLILEDLCEGPEEEKEFIAQAKAAALKMLALFDRVAAVSKLDVGREPPTLEAVDLSFLLPEVEMLTALQAANQNVRFAAEIPAETLEIYTDATWLKHILVSLIQDAIPHTKTLSLAATQDGQSVTITIECDGVSESVDRSAAGLQAELDAIANATGSRVEPTSETISTASIRAVDEAASTLELSTGLVLAMAHTALPPVQGTFTITTNPDDEERTQLRCCFQVP